MTRSRLFFLPFALPLAALGAACSSAGATSLEGSDPVSEGSTVAVTADASAGASASPSTSLSSASGAGSSGGSGAMASAGSDAGATPLPTTGTSEDAGGAAATDAGADAGSAAASCPYTGTPLNTSAFPSCGSGAVCAPTALIPPASQADFASCTGGLCVPSKVVAAHGNYVPATCSSLAAAEGRCLNTVLPSVSAQASQLPQDTCDADERCVPCFSPLDGTSTGACTTVSCDAPKDPPTTFASCCNMGGAPQGKCVPSSVAGASASELDTAGCSGADLCAPTEDLNPAFVPQPCEADDSVLGFFTGGYTGVCVSQCIPQDFVTGLGTAQGNCDDLHFCAPCSDPISGDPTGVPGCPNQ